MIKVTLRFARGVKPHKVGLSYSRDNRAGVDYPSVVCFAPRDEKFIFLFSTIITNEMIKVTTSLFINEASIKKIKTMV
jgi:hypothetical protein